ncbi:MAG: type II CAAX endopeptidase family protein [Dehalococcoidia bacterium]
MAFLTRVRRHPIAAFFTLAYGLSWLAWLAPALGVGGVLGTLALFAGGFGPAVAAAIVAALLGGGAFGEWARGLVRWRVAPRWYLAAVGLPFAVMALAIAGFAALGLPVDLTLLPGRLALVIPTFVLIALAQGGNEEPGWRGFALPRLQERCSPVVASLILGALWAAWHLPVLFASPESQHGFGSLVALLPSILVTFVNIVGLTFVYTWLVNGSRSTLIAILFHATGNTVNALFIPLPDAALVGAVYWIALLVTSGLNLALAVAITAATRGRLGYQTWPAPHAVRPGDRALAEQPSAR